MKLGVQNTHQWALITNELSIGPKRRHSFLKLGAVFSRVRTTEIWQESDATLAPIHFFISLDSDPSVNSQTQGKAMLSLGHS